VLVAANWETKTPKSSAASFTGTLILLEPEASLRGGAGMGVRTRRAGQMGERAGAGRRDRVTRPKQPQSTTLT